MAIQIANPEVIAKIEQLSRETGLGKTAVVNAALDQMIAARQPPASEDPWAEFNRILEQLHKLPDRPDAYDPLEWDENGLPI